MNEQDLENINNTIETFKNVIINNTNHKYIEKIMGFTSISVKTKITGKLKVHTFILIIPTAHKHYSQYQKPYFGKYCSLHLQDFYLHVNENFSKFVHNEIMNKNILPIISFQDDLTWCLNNHYLFIHTKNNEPHNILSSFDDWYNNYDSFDLSNYEITIINPDTYSVFFKVYDIKL
jgi:hypothetical protein